LFIDQISENNKKKTANIKNARANTEQKRKEDEFPERRKEKQPEARKAMPAKRDEASLQTLRYQRLLVSSDEISCCCTFRTCFF
jgi:hypothetical protein